MHFLDVGGSVRLAVNDVGNAEVPTNGFDVVNGILPKQPLQDARNEVDHNRVAHLPQVRCKFAEYLHRVRVDDQR